MIHRSAAFAQIEHGIQRAADVILGPLYRFFQRKALGQVGRDGAGERASGAVRIGVVDALPIKPLPVISRLQIIIGIIDLMPALDQDIA